MESIHDSDEGTPQIVGADSPASNRTTGWDHLLYAAMAFLSAFALTLVFRRLYPDSASLWNGIAVLVFVLQWSACVHLRWRARLRPAVITCIGGFFLSLFVVLGANINSSGGAELFRLRTVVAVLCLVPLMSVVLLLAHRVIDRGARNPLPSRMERRLVSWTEKQWASDAVVTIFLLIAWTPALLAEWPGIYAYDAIPQMLQWTRQAPLTSHYPLLDNVFLASTLAMGRSLFGSDDAGLLIHSIIQMVILAVVLAYVAHFIGRRWSRTAQLCSVLVFALYPFNAVFAISTTTRDTIYGGLLLLFMTQTLHLCDDPPAFAKSWPRVIGYGANAFLLAVLRSTGVYVLLVFFVILVIVYRSIFLALLKSLAVVVVAMVVYVGPVYALVGVGPPDKDEPFSLPAQQISRALATDWDDIDPADRQLAASYVPNYAAYQPFSTDPVRDTINVEMIEDDPVAFLKLWARIGADAPTAYADGFLVTNAAFWYPSYNYYVNFVEIDNQSAATFPWLKDVNLPDIHREVLVPAFDTYYRQLCLNMEFRKYPLLPLVLGAAAPIWLIVAVGSSVCVSRRWTSLPVLVLAFGTWAMYLLGPVGLTRYVYPLMLAMPLIFLLGSPRNASESQDSTPSETQNSGVSETQDSGVYTDT